MTDEIYISDLNEELDSHDYISLDNVYDNLSKQRHFQDTDENFSPVAGFPKDFFAHIQHDPKKQMWERHSLYKLIEKTNCQQSFREILAKGLAYREMPLYSIFRGPVTSKDLCRDQWRYWAVIKRIVTGDGCTAYLLGALNNSESLDDTDYYLVFSGSQFHFTGLDSLSSYIRDCDYRIGRTGIIEAEKFFEQLFVTPSDCPLKVIPGALHVLGHSLGGALAQWFVYIHTGTKKKIKVQLLETYNSPGMSPYKITMKTSNLTIRIIRTRWDIVHWAGAHHLTCVHGGIVRTVTFVWNIDSSPLTTNVHTYLCMANPCELEIEGFFEYTRLPRPGFMILDLVRGTLGLGPVLVLTAWRGIWRYVVPSRVQTDYEEPFVEYTEMGYSQLKQ